MPGEATRLGHGGVIGLSGTMESMNNVRETPNNHSNQDLGAQAANTILFPMSIHMTFFNEKMSSNKHESPHLT